MDEKELEYLLRKAASHNMTPAERDAQRLSWVYGNLPESDTRSKEDIAKSLGLGSL